MSPEAIQRFLLVIPVLLFSIVAHEIAHGYVALRQGDPTAYQLGRLTWNPIKHIDPFMSIVLPAMLALVGMPVFGAAKPVPVNSRNYRNFKRGDILVSLAGVTANFFIAFICAGLVVLLGLLARVVPVVSQPLAILQAMVWLGILLNFGLIAFNLIPLPPLDGSHVFKYLLPPAWSFKYQMYGGRFGFVLIFVLLYFGRGFLNFWFTPAFWAAGILQHAASGFLIPFAGA